MNPLKANPNRRLRDRPRINFTVIEEKNGSDFEDFSAADISSDTSKEKSSIDGSIFPSITVKFILGRSLIQNSLFRANCKPIMTF